MTDNIGVVITGDRQVAIKFDQFPIALHDPLKATITSLTGALAANIRAAAPDKTGKLRSEIQDTVFDDGADRIVGFISVSGDFAKAGALEYGAHRATRVSAHTAKLDHVWSKRLNAPLTVLIQSYSRRQNVTATRFERGPTQAMSADIAAALEETVNQATQAFNGE